MTKPIGSAKIITFHTTRNDRALITPLRGMFQGTTTGHAALLLTFTDKELFDKYIANNDKIPHKTKIDPKTQDVYYEVYISFWPQTSAGLSSQPSKFVDHEFDEIASADYSPFYYDPKWLSHQTYDNRTAEILTSEKLDALIEPLELEVEERRRVKELVRKSSQKSAVELQPLKRVATPTLPLLRDQMQSEVHLGPMIMVHYTRILNTFGKDITEAVVNYADLYRQWRELNIKAQNYAEKKDLHASKIYTEMAEIYQAHMRASEQSLKATMYPNDNLTHSEFMDKLEPYITFGNPERDSFTIPIVRNFDPEHPIALELEPMLQYVCEVANNPNVHLYNVLKLNCAAVTYNTLWAGAKNSPHSSLKHYLSLAWYVNMLGVTITPIMLIQNASRAEETQRKALQFSSSSSVSNVTFPTTGSMLDLFRSSFGMGKS